MKQGWFEFRDRLVCRTRSRQGNFKRVALVIGPTGLLYDGAADVLYVASTGDNAIFMIPHAGSAGPTSGTGKLVFTGSHLRGPLALALAPNGNLLTSNGDAVNPDPAQPSEIVEFTKTGTFIGEYNIHQNQGGAFGVATFTEGTANLGTVNPSGAMRRSGRTQAFPADGLGNFAFDSQSVAGGIGTGRRGGRVVSLRGLEPGSLRECNKARR